MIKGAIYIVTQDRRYLDMLLISAASLRRAMPDLPITVFSEFSVESPCFDDVIIVKATEDGFYDKTKLIAESPYERTVFIDVDTYVVEPFTELFSLLDWFDIAVTHEEYLNTDWFNWYPRDDIPSSFPEFNTGVLLFKKSTRTQHVFKDWRNLYMAYREQKPDQQINDQPFFRAAIYYSDLRIATLTREYNCKFRGQGYLNGTVKILHGHHAFRLDPKHVSKVTSGLNASKRPRVYIAGKVFERRDVGRLVGHRTAHKVGHFPEPPESITLLRIRRLKELIKEQGVRKIAAKTVRGVLGDLL